MIFLLYKGHRYRQVILKYKEGHKTLNLHISTYTIGLGS